MLPNTCRRNHLFYMPHNTIMALQSSVAGTCWNQHFFPRPDRQQVNQRWLTQYGSLPPARNCPSVNMKKGNSLRGASHQSQLILADFAPQHTELKTRNKRWWGVMPGGWRPDSGMLMSAPLFMKEAETLQQQDNNLVSKSRATRCTCHLTKRPFSPYNILHYFRVSFF